VTERTRWDALAEELSGDITPKIEAKPADEPMKSLAPGSMFEEVLVMLADSISNTPRDFTVPTFKRFNRTSAFVMLDGIVVSPAMDLELEVTPRDVLSLDDGVRYGAACSMVKARFITRKNVGLVVGREIMLVVSTPPTMLYYRLHVEMIRYPSNMESLRVDAVGDVY
jgi:hypothetical protein